MDDLLFGLISALSYILIVRWSLSKTYAHEHGYFIARHRWAQKIVRRASELLDHNVIFCDNEMELRISQYLENRAHGRYRTCEADLKEFYMDDSKILWMLLTVSYEAMLFASFAGTELAVECAHPYQEVFDAAAKKLEQMGFDCTKEIEKCKAMTAETHEFCRWRNFSLYK